GVCGRKYPLRSDRHVLASKNGDRDGVASAIVHHEVSGVGHPDAPWETREVVRVAGRDELEVVGRGKEPTHLPRKVVLCHLLTIRAWAGSPQRSRPRRSQGSGRSRSEERRVGKECGSRRTPKQNNARVARTHGAVKARRGW